MPLTLLHPLTLRWFRERFAAPTEPQRRGWPAIAAGRDTLIAAPTGSGKTLAAFLFGLDRLLRAADGVLDGLGGGAQSVYEALCRRGALFAAQLAPLVSMPPAQVEDALGELVAAGLVTCDGFAALRGLIVGARRRHLRRHAAVRPPQSGRWCLLRGFGEAEIDRGERAERWCQLLLRRYGVMFRDLLAREAAAPPWYELCRAFRRLEARGDIRGGRFVAQVAGEQYALPTIISGLRRKEEADDGMLTLAATDPLNLGGRGLPGVKIPAAAGNRIGLRCALAGSERAT